MPGIKGSAGGGDARSDRWADGPRRLLEKVRSANPVEQPAQEKRKDLPAEANANLLERMPPEKAGTVLANLVKQDIASANTDITKKNIAVRTLDVLIENNPGKAATIYREAIKNDRGAATHVLGTLGKRDQARAASLFTEVAKQDSEIAATVFIEAAKKDLKGTVRILSALVEGSPEQAATVYIKATNIDTKVAVGVLGALEKSNQARASLFTEVAKQDPEIAQRSPEVVNEKTASLLVEGAKNKGDAEIQTAVDILVEAQGRNRAGAADLLIGAAQKDADVAARLLEAMIERDPSQGTNLFADVAGKNIGEAARIHKAMEIEPALGLLDKLDDKLAAGLIGRATEIRDGEVAGPLKRVVERLTRHLKLWGYAYGIGTINIGYTAAYSGSWPWSGFFVAGIANVLAGKALRPFKFRGREILLNYPKNAFAQTTTAVAALTVLGHIAQQVQNWF